jgi:hypothetical protein
MVMSEMYLAVAMIFAEPLITVVVFLVLFDIVARLIRNAF